MESWGFTFDQSLSSAVAFGRDQVGLIGWELKPQLVSIPNELNFDNQIFGDTNFPPLVVQDHESKSQESGLLNLKLGRILDQKDNQISHSLSTSKGLGFCSSTPVCKVYGCNKNLSKCKEYYKRHKVCELHSKTSKVVVNGIEQRFCQQCSRFHLLREFDNGKRSCRKRLAGHNERRRKPHVGPLFDRHLPSYNISVQGNEFHETAVAISSFANCNDLPSPHQPMHKTNARWDMNLEAKSAQNVQSTSNITGEQFHSISVSPCNFETSPRVINECTRGSISSPESARSLLSSQSGKTSTHSYIGQPVLLGSHDFDNIVGFPDNMVELEVMHHDEKVLRDESCMIDLVRLSRQLDRVEHRKRKAQVNHAN